MSAAVPPARRLPARARWAFGVGSLAYGIKDNGFATFLLLFYNQVIGLPPDQVGAVIALVLVVEAFADPLVGFLSDNTRGAWGRRHPWMYASALPVAAGWLLLWNPPAGWSHAALLGYLFGAALLVRLALSTFEIPSSALGPELSSDYDERTKLFAYRYLFGWIGGLGMLFLAYAVFLVPDATHANGLQNAAGYGRWALLGAVLMALSILASSLALHPEIKHLPPAGARGKGLRDHFTAFGRAVANRGFLVLMVAGLFAYTAQGTSFALSNYLYAFVWRFAGMDYQYLALALLIGATGAFFLAPALTKRGDKRVAAGALALGNAILLSAPYFLHYFGLFPAPGARGTVLLVLAIFCLNTMVGVGAFIIGASMLSDVVEEAERRTGLRHEGVYFAGSFFVQKLVGGLGTLFAGLILKAAAFPANAQPGAVSEATIERLVLIFACTMLTVYGLGSFAYRRFPFGRAEHEARVAALAAEDRAG